MSARTIEKSAIYGHFERTMGFRTHGRTHGWPPRGSRIRTHVFLRDSNQDLADIAPCIRRAERRLGEMMAAQPKAMPPNPKPPKDRRVDEKPDDRPATLAEAGKSSA